jgi:hypothetical protein
MGGPVGLVDIADLAWDWLMSARKRAAAQNQNDPVVRADRNGSLPLRRRRVSPDSESRCFPVAEPAVMLPGLRDPP